MGDLQVGSLLGQVSGISKIKVMKLVLEFSGRALSWPSGGPGSNPGVEMFVCISKAFQEMAS